MISDTNQPPNRGHRILARRYLTVRESPLMLSQRPAQQSTTSWSEGAQITALLVPEQQERSKTSRPRSTGVLNRGSSCK